MIMSKLLKHVFPARPDGTVETIYFRKESVALVRVESDGSAEVTLAVQKMQAIPTQEVGTRTLKLGKDDVVKNGEGEDFSIKPKSMIVRSTIRFEMAPVMFRVPVAEVQAFLESVNSR